MDYTQKDILALKSCNLLLEGLKNGTYPQVLDELDLSTLDGLTQFDDWLILKFNSEDHSEYYGVDELLRLINDGIGTTYKMYHVWGSKRLTPEQKEKITDALLTRKIPVHINFPYTMLQIGDAKFYERLFRELVPKINNETFPLYNPYPTRELELKCPAIHSIHKYGLDLISMFEEFGAAADKDYVAPIVTSQIPDESKIKFLLSLSDNQDVKGYKTHHLIWYCLNLHRPELDPDFELIDQLINAGYKYLWEGLPLEKLFPKPSSEDKDRYLTCMSGIDEEVLYRYKAVIEYVLEEGQFTREFHKRLDSEIDNFRDDYCVIADPCGLIGYYGFFDYVHKLLNLLDDY